MVSVGVHDGVVVTVRGHRSGRVQGRTTGDVTTSWFAVQRVSVNKKKYDKSIELLSKEMFWI